MENQAPSAVDCGCRKKKTDRYITFDGIDCDGNARRVMEMIEQHAPESGQAKAFWDYFLAKRTPKSGPAPDDLFLVHSHINQIRELFESREDQVALDLLFLVEEECC
ncbi:MAG: N(2)-fixation sustaining protein CowN [Azonexaceae bacterium]|uniref:N(2)-fixation sustaining protein CowN n=1 Tax=Azonexus sp. R2A61 TaxID=2744443 RepID=UPI001F2F6AFA|nr:N(2)-fixation sustaining protein CowN [Azonexus sp. R2A61]MCE1240125.1 N(2)-fixation sustaining protein CowN [Azonexaceae bacterium]